MRRLHRRSVIEQAKAAVPLPMVLAMTGYPIEGLPPRGVAIKAWCPWTDMHPGEREKEMRVYAGNDCYCFICGLSMDPVSIAARWWSCSNGDAARRLLALRAERGSAEDGAGSEGPGLPGAVPGAAARRSGAVAALARWADARGVDRLSSEYGRCLDLADRITTDPDVVKWLDACKKYLIGDSKQS